MTEPRKPDPSLVPFARVVEQVEDTEVYSYLDPATGMIFMAMREWNNAMVVPTPGQIASAEKLEGKKWADERKRGPKRPRL